jgi:hypothetical protein
MWRRRSRGTPPSSETGAPPSQHQPVVSQPSARGELLFAVPGPGAGSLQLDCLVWDEALQASLPLTVSAQLPQDSLAGYLSAMAVDAWCANHEDVAVELWLAGRRPKLALSCRDSRVVLTLPPE